MPRTDRKALAVVDKRRERRKARETPAAAPAMVAPSADPAPVGFVRLLHEEIDPDPENARKAFDGIDELADTIASHGMLQKPVVWQRPDGRWQLTMGERRWRAWAKLIADGRWPAAHTEPCLIETADERARMEAALIENLQRLDLNHMEVGHGFELLGSRFHLANDQIAARTGRTKEYVQQHRRLTKLDADDQVRMAAGKITMHDALRIVAKPSPKTLSAKELLLFGELVLLIRIHPAKERAQYYGGGCEVGHQAASDPVLKALRERSVLSFEARDYRTKRAYVSVSYEGREFAEQLDKAFAENSGLPDRLHEIRLAAIGEEAAEKARAGDLFVTPWLNGPFELHPDAAAQLAAEKASRAKERDAQKAQKIKREAALTAVKSVAERALKREVILPADDALPALFKKETIAFPLESRGQRVVDAKGDVVCDANWRFGENGERVAALLALALNLARGRLPASLEEPSEPEAEINGASVETPSDDASRAATTGPLAGMLGDQFSRDLRDVQAEGG